MQKAELQQSWQDLKQIKFLKLYAIVLAISFVLTVALLVWRTAQLPPVVPFFYSLPWGEEQLASPLLLWFLVGGAAILVAVNWIAAWIVRPTSAFLSNTLIGSSAIIFLLGCYAIWRIVFLVT